MALSKPVGAAAAGSGMIVGLGVLIETLSHPDVSECIQKVATVLGPHASAIGAGVVGLVAGAAPLVAWLSHSPIPLSAEQLGRDLDTHGEPQ